MVVEEFAEIKEYISLNKKCISKSKVEYLVSKHKLSFKDLKDNFDNDLHFALSILREPTFIVKNNNKIKVVRDKYLSLESLAELIDDNDSIVISDVHGSTGLLNDVLERLGVVKNNKRVFKGRLYQIGDLVDGRSDTDLECLTYGAEIFDEIICGNHEIAYFGGPHFNGQYKRPGLNDQIKGLVEAGIIIPAVIIDNTLISHAGVNCPDESIDEVFQRIMFNWNDHKHNPNYRNEFLFAYDYHRGGLALNGGLMAADWKGRFPYKMKFSQIVGHTPVGDFESKNGNHCIDVAGSRLGVALIKNNKIIKASSTIIKP